MQMCFRSLAALATGCFIFHDMHAVLQKLQICSLIFEYWYSADAAEQLMWTFSCMYCWNDEESDMPDNNVSHKPAENVLPAGSSL